MSIKNKAARIFHSLPEPVQRWFRAAFHPIYKRNELEEVIDVARKFGLGKGDLVFDIGANVGNYAEAYLKLGASVVCVEPNKDCCGIMRKRFLDYPYKYLQFLSVEQAAISDKRGIAKFYKAGNNDISESSTCSEEMMAATGLKFRKPTTVKTTTLDILMRKYGVPDFVKLDVEGFELKALRGLGEHRPKTISFEYHNNRIKNALDCLALLSSQGYTRFECIRHERFPTGAFGGWGTLEMVQRFVKEEAQDKHIDGDIYARRGNHDQNRSTRGRAGKRNQGCLRHALPRQVQRHQVLFLLRSQATRIYTGSKR